MRVKYNQSAWSFIGIFVLLLAPLFFVGCSTAAAKKPTEAAALPKSEETGKKEASATKSQNLPSSSLEAAREGKTPAEGPLKDIYFDFDRYDLRTDAREVLQSNADWLKSNPSAVVQIEGHCDERGTTEYNMALGAKRAQAAKDYLVTLGISAQRLSTISYGKELPVCTEHTEECWQKNRHDRFVVKKTPTA